MNERIMGVARLKLGVVFAAALSACGGGSVGVAGAPGTAATAAGVGGASISSVSGASDLDTASAPARMGTLGIVGTNGGSDVLAAENVGFSVLGTQVVQYGSGDRWLSKSVSGSAMCSNAFFGRDPAAGVAKSCKLATVPTSDLAVEGAAFTVSGTQVVRYGFGGNWITKNVTNSGSCSNGFFGGDPVVNVPKSCQLAVASVTTLAVEGGTFTTSGIQVVQYGAADRWLTKSVSGQVTCSNGYFGIDPAPQVVKSCQLATTVAAVSSLSTEGQAFTVSGTQLVRYGVGTQWVTKSITSGATCSNAVFGTDPMPGVVKSCQIAPSAATFAGIVAAAPSTAVAGTPVPTATSVATTTPVATATSSLMPTIDMSKIPAPAVGYSTERVMAANVADPSQRPVPSDIGNFREPCDFSHMSYDDPIVFPGKQGGHLHTFFGNTGTNRDSTVQSIATTGNSTCAGGISNRTAYWVPTLIDTKDGTPLKPIGSLMYYKQGYNYVPSAASKAMPAGLRIVAGNSASAGIQDGIAGFTCFKPDGTWDSGQSMPAKCPAGSTLTIGVSFPQCWDGINIDSPDHKSHMAYPGIGCPASHPVPLPHITLNINYRVDEADATARYRLSSDNYDRGLPGGYSSHADWFNGWSADILNVWVPRCINASMDCHAFLLGDGRTLY